MISRIRITSAMSRLALAALLLPLALAAAPKATPSGSLNLNSVPNGATVKIDRRAVGTTPLNTPLSVGEHLVAIELAGHQPAWRTVNIVAEETYSLSFELVPLTGLILVHSTPSDAEIIVDGLDHGRTPALVTSLPLGSHRLRLELPGYRAKEIEVNLTDRTPQHVNVDLTSSSATLHISANIPAADIFLNGIARGTTPATLERIPAGEAMLEVRAPGYISYSQPLKLAEGEVQQIQARLEEQPGTLQIVSLPTPARVYLNNEFRGETPLQLTPLAAGSHRIRVERDGFEPNARTLTLERGANRTEEFRLTGNSGRILITTEPGDATIILDGETHGKTLPASGEGLQASAPYPLELIPEGAHTIQVVRQGYFDKTLPVNVSRGETTPLHIKLERRFIPNYEITTSSGSYCGVLIERGSDAIRLEIAPGVISTYLMKDILRHNLLPDAQP